MVALVGVRTEAQLIEFIGATDNLALRMMSLRQLMDSQQILI
jgi:hypothetical protein